MKHVKLFEDFNDANEIMSLINEAEDAISKIKARFEKKIDSLITKAERHYDKEENVAEEDIKDTLLPIVRKMMQAEILLAKAKAEKKPSMQGRIDKIKEAIAKLKEGYDKEYDQYRENVQRERRYR